MHNICIIYNYNYKSTWNDLYIDDGARKFQRWRYYRPTWPHWEGPSRLKLTYLTRLAGLALPVVITGRLQTNCRVIMSSGIVRQGIQRCHPVLCAVWTLLEPVSPTIFEIMGIVYIWVTTLTFLGQVTSSVTWPIDPPYFISYWCPIVTEPLSLTVFEIFDPQYPCAHTHTHTHKHRNTPQVILYSVPCNVLHWTDNNISVIFFIVAIIMDVLYRPTHPHTGTRDIVCGTTLKSVNFSSSSNPSWIPPSKTGYQASFGRSNTNDVDGIQSQETNSHAELCVLDFVFVDFLSYCLAVFLSPSCSQLKNV